MKRAWGKQITMGLMVAMIAASPVFAETNPTMSDTLKRKKKPASTTSQKQEPVQTQQGGTVGPVVSGTNRLNLPPMEKPTPGQDIQVQNGAESEIAPYLNKTLTKISIEGNQEISAEDIQKKLTSIPGLPLTEEDVNSDLQAIYNMGWFSDLYPTYEAVPEGVQVTYHVLENPNFSHLEVTGNTKLSTEKIRNIVNLRPGKMVNIREFKYKYCSYLLYYKQLQKVLSLFFREAVVFVFTFYLL